MKLKNIESIDELKVGDDIYDHRGHHKITAKCEGAVMVLIHGPYERMYYQQWLDLSKLKDEQWKIEDKSEEWVPKEGERVWTTNFLEASGVEEIRYSPHLWAPVVLLKRGLIFRTKEEARDCAKKMLEAIKK